MDLTRVITKRILLFMKMYMIQGKFAVKISKRAHGIAKGINRRR